MEPPLNDVTSVWKTDSLIGGGLSMNVENHGEISFTIPTNCDNVYTVLDQLLRMHREDREMITAVVSSSPPY